MEEEKKKEIIWWQHLLNFLFNIVAGYAFILLIGSQVGLIYLGVQAVIFFNYLRGDRRQDILMQVLVVVTGLLIGYSLCVSNGLNI